MLGTRPPGAVPFQLGAPGAPPPATRPKSITLSGQEVSTKGGGAPAWLAAAPPPSPPRPVTPALDATELLWFAPAAVPEIRRTFRPLLVASGLDGADAPDGTPADDLLCVLGAGQPLDAAELEEALEDGIGPNGQFRAPLVLVRGALRFPLDPAAAQKAREALGWSSLGLRPAKPGSAPNPAQAADEAEIDRHLLLRRCYERRTVLGEDQIRALLSPAGSQAAVPAYLPVAAAKVLPLFPSIPVRLIAEARPQQDCFEDHPVALRVVALGWDISVRART